MTAPEGGAQAVLRRILADPPVVHAMDFSDSPPLGLWATDPDCYALLADHIVTGTRTLETGAGLSTVLFAALGAVHTCVTPSTEEAERIRSYCRAHRIDTSGLAFALGRSDEVLPTLSGELDLVFIDGSHGYPTPIVDWYYGAGRLVDGGILVVDDAQLPAVDHLVWVLDRDPRWIPICRSAKWVAWRRRGGGPLGQDWFQQPWLPAPLPTDPAALARRAVDRLRRRARRPPAS